MPTYVHRELEKRLAAAARSFPALVLTGLRPSGKTTLMRYLFPKASYVLAEDPDVVARLRADPHAFSTHSRLRSSWTRSRMCQRYLASCERASIVHRASWVNGS
jgi:hypothetical protein